MLIKVSYFPFVLAEFFWCVFCKFCLVIENLHFITTELNSGIVIY